MLKTETQTRSVERQIRSAARSALHVTRFDTDFEHGQWWVTDRESGAQWSVVDTNNGFDFELVTQGDE